MAEEKNVPVHDSALDDEVAAAENGFEGAALGTGGNWKLIEVEVDRLDDGRKIMRMTRAMAVRSSCLVHVVTQVEGEGQAVQAVTVSEAICFCPGATLKNVNGIYRLA